MVTIGVGSFDMVCVWCDCIMDDNSCVIVMDFILHKLLYKVAYIVS